MLIERNRTMLIPQIREIFDDQLRAERGIAVAEVTTAERLTDAELDHIREKLETMTGKKIELALKIDPDIIGGIIVLLAIRLLTAACATNWKRCAPGLSLGGGSLTRRPDG